MAKNTHSQELQTGTANSHTDHEFSDPTPPYQVQREMIGILREGDEPSDGQSLKQSSLTEQHKKPPSKVNPQEPAQTTGSPSNQQETENSTARTTGGSGQKTTAPRSGRKTSTSKRAPNTRTLDAEDSFSEFE